MDSKECTKCKQIKPPSSFDKRKDGTLGLRSHCKKCIKQTDKKSRERYKAKNHTYNFHKVCLSCNLNKHATEFSKCRSKSNGIASQCKKCSAIRTNAFYKTIRGRFSRYRCGARRRNLKFHLTLEEFEAIILKSCHYCNKENANGIDRIDSSQHYVLDNCTPCCTTCNRMKMDHEQQYFIQQCKLIAENFSS